MEREDKEVIDQLLLEQQRRENRAQGVISLGDRASASAPPTTAPYHVYAIQGGTPTERKAQASRTQFGTQK
eukprot:13613028-Heterocapsa_arctica.AAC.1